MSRLLYQAELLRLAVPLTRNRRTMVPRLGWRAMLGLARTAGAEPEVVTRRVRGFGARVLVGSPDAVDDLSKDLEVKPPSARYIANTFRRLRLVALWTPFSHF